MFFPLLNFALFASKRVTETEKRSRHGIRFRLFRCPAIINVGDPGQAKKDTGTGGTLEDPDPTSEVQRKPLQLRSHFGNIFKIHVISSKYIYRIYIYTYIHCVSCNMSHYESIICVLVLLVFIFSCFLWKISAQDIEQNLEFIGEVRDAVYFPGTCLGNSGACARPRKRSAWKRCWWVRSRPLLFMSQWEKKVTFIITLCFFSTLLC